MASEAYPTISWDLHLVTRGLYCCCPFLGLFPQGWNKGVRKGTLSPTLISSNLKLFFFYFSLEDIFLFFIR